MHTPGKTESASSSSSHWSAPAREHDPERGHRRLVLHLAKDLAAARLWLFGLRTITTATDGRAWPCAHGPTSLATPVMGRPEMMPVL